MEDTEVQKFDVIVVGAGPAGVSAALSAKRCGAKTLLVERSGHVGTKNMIGGAVFLTALKEIFPDSWEQAPIERYINKHTWSLLTDNSSVDVSCDFPEAKKSASIYRSKFDLWLVEKAKEEGVYFAPSTLVKNLIIKEDCVCGVQTELEKIEASVVILADGVNSLLARQTGLRKDYEPKDMVLSIKETIKLSKETLEERFNIKNGSKNGDCVSLGLGLNLEDLTKYELNPSDLLEKLKEHPVVSPLIQGGELLEYSAHLIPEGGYKKLPKLYKNGVLLVGDAAGFVNGIHFEGTNYALISGKFAGETAAYAVKIKDYSKKTLSLYGKKLEKSFILKDLKSYQNVMENLYLRTNSLMNYYPKFASEFFKIFCGANCVPKRDEFRGLIIDFIRGRSLKELFWDIKAFLSCIFGVLK